MDCGSTSTSHPDDSVSACGEKALQERRPFFLGYYSRNGDVVDFAYGVAGDAAGNVFAVIFEPPGFPGVAPDRHTQVLDDNQTRVTECTKPVAFTRTKQGMLACIPPVNEEESAIAARQKPIDTTVCAVVDSPAAFNNKLVRIRGHYSGNFEYSILSGEGCGDSLWFGYGGGGGPPGLAAHVGGGARPGSEDSQGKRILPIPVKLVRNAKFEHFENLMVARDNADAESEKENPDKFVFHCVTATFVGRIDAVSSEIHEFRKKQPAEHRSSGLGFGQMGLFEAQLVVQSVEDDATMGVCGK